MEETFLFIYLHFARWHFNKFIKTKAEFEAFFSAAAGREKEKLANISLLFIYLRVQV